MSKGKFKQARRFKEWTRENQEGKRATHKKRARRSEDRNAYDEVKLHNKNNMLPRLSRSLGEKGKITVMAAARIRKQVFPLKNFEVTF